MPRCEDYPCCGHGPVPQGDGGGCPDSIGRFNCTECGRLLPRKATSSICKKCQKSMRDAWLDEDWDYSMNN